jgi:1-phosphofructokinase
MKNTLPKFDVVTITLNPAMDLTITLGNFTPGAVNRVAQSHSAPGGKGVNVASALASDGHRVAATGFLGRENSGDFEALFAANQIEDCFVRIPGRTRTGIKITDPVRHETTDINFPGLTPAPADLDLLHGQLAALDAPWFVVGGSIPPGIDAAVYRGIIRTLKARGGRVALDTSGDALRHGIEAAPDIIKPNIHELEALVGEPLKTQPEVVKAAQKLMAKGIKLVVVSMGREGACFISETDVVMEYAPEIEVKSTVGAGDAMVAGIIAAQLRKLPLAACARLATGFSVELLKRNATR